VIGGGLRSEANRTLPEDGGAIPSVQGISPRSIPSQQRMGGSPAEIYPEAAVSRRSVGTPSVDLQPSFPPTRHSFSGGPTDPTQRAGLYEEIGWLTRKIQVVEGPAGLPPNEALDRLLDRVTGEKAGELDVEFVHGELKKFCRASGVHRLEIGESDMAAKFEELALRLEALEVRHFGESAAAEKPLETFNAQ
jgi:hypothetical protein